MKDTNCGHTCYAQEAIVESCETLTKAKVKGKRDIVRFDGETPIAMDLQHVDSIILEGKKISFEMAAKLKYVELESEEAAKNMFDALLNLWSSE